MPKTAITPDRKRERRAANEDELRQWRFSKTITFDSVVMVVFTVLSAFVSGVLTYTAMKNEISLQGQEIQHIKEQTKSAIDVVQRSVDRVATESEKASTRIEKDQAERSQRLEAAIKETNQLVQSAIVPRLQR